jgi:hypothetical protein
MTSKPHAPGTGAWSALLTGICLALMLLLGACAPAPSTEPLPSATDTPGTLPATDPALGTPATLQPESTSTGTALPPDFWESLPVVPTQVSGRLRAIYQQGAELGRSAQTFSRIGDCASAAPAFITGFGGAYDLAEFAYLQPAVDYFRASFARPSYAAKAGLSTAGVLSTIWTDEKCLPAESLLACQYRLDNPAFAFIALGTNEAYSVHHEPGAYERNMRLILETTIDLGIIPILVTKADNTEGDNSINPIIARLALEYEIPLWNFWLAVQDIPDHGLLEIDHLTTVSYINYVDFSLPHALEYGMQVRNLTALQVLDFLWRALEQVPTTTPGE